MEKFDAIIIGIGQAGPSIAARCAKDGLKTAIIEKDKFGGTCVNTGCTPTKAMVASARVAHQVQRAKEYGVEIEGNVSINFSKIKERKDELVKNSSDGVQEWLTETEGIEVIEGHARFVSNKVIKVGNRSIAGDKIFINTGGRASIPEGVQNADYLTNADIMNLDEIPKHLVIVGGSYIGLEFGQMFRRFGSKVTIVEMREKIIGREDPESSQCIKEILEEEGIQFRMNAECISATNTQSGVEISVDCDDGPPTIEGTHLLVATGRKPNTDDLGLEHTEIETDENGFIITNDTLETSVNNIWAVGDVTGKGAFTHTAYNDYEIVTANIFDDDPRKVSDRILCYSLFTDPSLSHVGMYEHEAKSSDKNVLVGYRDMSRIARAKERGETKGFIKILVDRDSKRILGATMIGVGSDEIIHSILDIMYADKPYTVISRAVHIHPTISELIPTILQNLKPLEG